jgi:hypothetical protein
VSPTVPGVRRNRETEPKYRLLVFTPSWGFVSWESELHYQRARTKARYDDEAVEEATRPALLSDEQERVARENRTAHSVPPPTKEPTGPR